MAWNTAQSAYPELRPLSGEWLISNGMAASPAGAQALVSGQATFLPFFTGKNALSVQAIGCCVSAAQVAGTTTTSLGLYADDGAGRPNLAQLLASTTVVLTSTGNRTSAVSAVIPPYGIAWGCFLYVQTAAPTTVATIVGYNGAPYPPPPIPNGSAFSGIFRSLVLTGQSALPTTGTPVGGSGLNPPLIALQSA